MITKEEWCKGMAELILFVAETDVPVPIYSETFNVSVTSEGNTIATSDKFRAIGKKMGAHEKQKTDSHVILRKKFGAINYDVYISTDKWDGKWEEDGSILQSLRRRFDL